MMRREHDPDNERDPATGAQDSGAKDLFSAEGTIRPVVPLSEVDGPARASTSSPAPAVSPDAEAGEEHEAEVATLVRPRLSSATALSSAHTFRSGSTGRSRHFRAAAYALVIITSLTAGALTGLLIGGYRKKPVRSANVERPAPPTEAGPQAIESQTDAQHAGPSVAVKPEPEPSTEVLSATVIESTHEPESPRAGRLTSQTAPPVAASEARRSSVTMQPPRREATAGTPATQRAASPTALENAVEGRRAPSATRGQQRTEGRVGAASSSHENLPPVFSPPAAGSAKKKVIPWP